MELFSEIYSSYFDVIKHIISKAEIGMKQDDLIKIINTYAFKESSFYIMPKILSGQWQFIKKDKNGLYYNISDIKTPYFLTTLQLSYIKSIIKDKRIKLFLDENEIINAENFLKDIKPLFYEKDFNYYDRFSNGDDYDNKDYIKNFKTILSSLKNKQYLDIDYNNKGYTLKFMPVCIEYSSKNDKFRLACVTMMENADKSSVFLNISKINKVQLLNESFNDINPYDIFSKRARQEYIVFEIYNERNALERCTLHFSNYERHTEYNEEKNCWKCVMHYDKSDETEILIRILSFGPVVKVTEPDNFVKMIKKRLLRQRTLFNSLK